ncbi:MAG: tRNA preQ1(34) S-adenosylmethionine ribosyltransferase-isomerase QueA [Planctomycetaceae bacterium]|nr:tRNA preQ1(34) S-adenosylmethionine ribosyltransferase-isomerase QueA [Planctomycetales bacterium]MCB9923617.1 tRNA preQ1(34) S-adenosylmethionine ribosyltransferase-isomerase QueA [Planctomycetaceae bacterium]
MAEIDHYDYDLPKELIAQRPLTRRVDARLLVVDRRRDEIEHCYVRDLPDLLSPQDALVLNNTRVIPARLVGYRTRTGGRWSGLFLSVDAHGLWQVLGQTRGKLQVGETVTLHDCDGRHEVKLKMLAKLDGGAWAAKPESEDSTFDVLESIGRVPLPPYIRDGEMTEQDRETYQTVYATHPGAVAAPTAGLHFTEAILNKIRQRAVRTCHVTLHVGIGTFRPISTESLDAHQMHSEWGSIDETAVQELKETRANGGRIVAVGTTSVRVLETATRSGVLQPWQGETDLFIRPPYEFRSVDALMTNFHLPKSTLLVLVRTFGGDELIQRAYDEAIREQYRFYSYGDAMLIL